MSRPIRPPHEDVSSYPAAVSWLREAWTTLPVPPVRLHVRAIEDGSQLGAHQYSTAFWRILAARPTDYETVTETDNCHHPGLAKDRDPRDCDYCAGDGVRQYERSRYRSPLAAALYGLSKVPPPAPDRPSSVDLIVALAWTGWDLTRAATAVRMPIVSDDHRQTMEALMLMTIRRLHSRYSSGPVGRPTRKSEAQLNAEDAA